jgi:hypothetical protein
MVGVVVAVAIGHVGDGQSADAAGDVRLPVRAVLEQGRC